MQKALEFYTPWTADSRAYAAQIFGVLFSAMSLVVGYGSIYPLLETYGVVVWIQWGTGLSFILYTLYCAVMSRVLQKDDEGERYQYYGTDIIVFLLLFTLMIGTFALLTSIVQDIVS